MKPTLAEIATRDQAQALVRDLAAGGIAVVFVDYATAETRCCWCTCPPSAGDHECPGCPDEASAVLRVVPEADWLPPWPVCRSHRDAALRLFEAIVADAIATGVLRPD